MMHFLKYCVNITLIVLIPKIPTPKIIVICLKLPQIFYHVGSTINLKWNARLQDS